MLKYFFALIMLVHGLIHVMGFAKAFGYGNINKLSTVIAKPLGLVWLVTALLFLVGVLLLIIRKDSWPYVVIIAAIISQILIISTWQDAKFGSIVNVVVMLVAIAAIASQNFEKQYTNDVKKHLSETTKIQTDLLTEEDMKHLPLPVQKYLRYCNVLNKPKVKNFRVVFDGQMREKGKDWFVFQSIQYNFLENPARLFFMKAKMFGVPVLGYHCYQNERATMQIKLLGLFNVVNTRGTEMNQAETVTVFNDLCLMAAAALIDKRIEWTPMDSLSAKATYTNGENKITAILYFNELGQLTNFTSDDRYAVDDMKQYRFSTPVKNYTKINGINIWKHGDAVWHYPDGEFVYGKFTLKSIEYNIEEFEK